MICARRAPSCFYPYVTHVINFTRLPPFSACNIENTRETGDEARVSHYSGTVYKGDKKWHLAAASWVDEWARAGAGDAMVMGSNPA